jgi:serine beta-lactamase-like protein LACTB, mitochondrial
MKKIVTVLSFLLAFTGTLAAQFSALSNTSFNQIQSYVTNRYAQQNMVGLSVGIIKNGEVIFLRGYGYSNLADSIASSEYTSYRLASVSKFLTAVLALKLADNNLLDLDEDIRNYVPEFPVKPEGIITSRHLLANQSGITHYNQCATYSNANLQTYVNTYTDTYNPISAINIFKDAPLCFAPGTDYRYSTFGFNLLAAVIERAGSGTFLEKYNNLIKCPTKMYGLYPEIQDLRPFPNESAWYRVVNGVILPPANSIDLTDVSFKTGGGGFTGTVIDMVKFMRAYVNRELLNDSLITLMHTVPQTNSTAGINYALGTNSAIRNGQRLVFHSGSQTGSTSLLYFSPENKSGLILLCNTQHVDLFPLARDIYDYLPQATTNGNIWEEEFFETEIDTLINHENNIAVLEATTSGGTPPYEYLWSTNESDEIITIEENANITLIVTDKFHCSKTANIEIVFSVSTIAYSDCENKNSNLKVYPNPTKNFINIDLDQNIGRVNISITDLYGKTVFNQDFENMTNEKINLEDFANGIYTLRIIDAELNNYNFKIIKN